MNVTNALYVPMQNSISDNASTAVPNAVVDSVVQPQDASTSQTSSAMIDPSKLTKAVEELNKRLEGTPTKVVLDPAAPANELWLDVVNKNTGEVIQKFPPEGLRKFAESSLMFGLALDLLS